MITNTNRISSLDLIRGFAVMGMIFINMLVFIPDFYQILFQESIEGRLTLDALTYKIIYIFFDGKMRALFTLVFGAGIVVFFTSNINARFNRSDYFSKRMLLLLLFALIHAYVLLWPGSILFEYAICGFLLLSLRGLSAKILLVLSISILIFFSYLESKDFYELKEAYNGYEKANSTKSGNQIVQENVKEQKERFETYLAGFPPFPESIKEKMNVEKKANIKLYTSSLKNIYTKNKKTSTERLSLGVYLFILESLGTMLLGMALFKLGFFEFYRRIHCLLIFLCIPLGIFLYYFLYNWKASTKGELIEIYSWINFSSQSIEGVARIIFSLGYCSLLIFFNQMRIISPFLELIRNVGKMAFSNYVAQTFIFVVLFYVFKFYGHFNIIQITSFSIIIISVQLAASHFCIKFFGSGQLEYLWRKMASKHLPD